MKNNIVWFTILLTTLLCTPGACTPRPETVQSADQPLVLYPEYQDVTIPCNVAPLNFLLRNEGVDALCVSVKGSTDSLQINARGNKAVFPLKAWHALLESEKGNTLTVTVTARTAGRWLRHEPFTWQVVVDSVDAYISYRLIEPGYEVWNALQIRERCIENFDERILADNKLTGNSCMNCHVHGANSGSLSMFHLRGQGGGTMLNRNGKLRKLNIKNDEMVAAATYGDFHPHGRYAVFSTNIIIPLFHATNNHRLEVYDTVSDLIVADLDQNRIITSPLTADSTALETFPTFSPDGKWIYYCSAPQTQLPDSIKQLHYSLCRIAFDAEQGSWGSRVDTIWNARLTGASVCHPKLSPDGRYLLYTVANYGTFPIWHRETDLQLMDLQTGSINTLQAVNSNRSDTYHGWSASSRWFAFASKRGDGQYGRIYFAYLDADGVAHKPFVLPQSNPEMDDLTLKSYNIPDLSTSPVFFDAHTIEQAYKEMEVEEFE
ncbi:hypothetical protein LJC72_09380 [Bacteroides sp. OttesenSCG-928-D19]|nr:hypothetical protein [Bacteroides sp. OttesenSCG-928-N06]MDL2305533.1 hypothetical protein [Bacteroides sp. OttesenSCG-928-D19]